jgi:sialic acid synthase SpsE
MWNYIKKMTINFGKTIVGDEQPCYVIAEIGSNHNHDLDLALRTIDAAAKAKANAVKFQTFKAAKHYSKRTPKFNYLDGIDTYSLIKSLELNRKWHSKLKQHAESQGIEFFSSPCDEEAILELEELGVNIYKIASFDLPDVTLISSMAKTGKPVIMSTGMAFTSDIENAVNACRQQNNDDIVLLQCTSLYPAAPNLSNLRSMHAMRSAFGCLVGYSDHTQGDHISTAAVTLGACVIEKHFTLDRTLPGPDHPFAIQPDELETMISKIRDIESALGDGYKNGPRASEKEMCEKGRRSIHAARNIKNGEVIKAEDIAIKRPSYGISPVYKDIIIGRTAQEDIEEDQWITWEMI